MKGIVIVILVVCMFHGVHAGKDVVRQIKNKVDSIIKDIDSLDATIKKNMEELRNRNVHTEVFVDVNDDPKSTVSAMRSMPFKQAKGYFEAFKEELTNAEEKK